MNYLLPTTYLLILSIVLATVTGVLIGQVIKKREVEKNLSELQEKIRNNSITAMEYYNLGVIYLSKKLFDQAILQFRLALKDWDLSDLTGLAILYNTIGFTYFETKQYDLSIYYYTQAIKYSPTYVVALNNLAYAYEKKRMIKNALEVYRQVLSYENDNKIAMEKVDKLSKSGIIRDDRI